MSQQAQLQAFLYRVATANTGPRPVKWCARLGASSSLELYAAWAIASTSSGSSAGGESVLVTDSTLM